MADWQVRGAKQRGKLVATTLSQAWYSSPPPLEIPAAEFALAAPVLLDSPAAALVWNKLRSSPPGLPLGDEFHDAYRLSSLRSEVRAINLSDALEKLRRVGVEPIVHKGWATARLYPEPGLRLYSDIDLLIRPDQLQTAEAAMNGEPKVDCPIDFAHSEITELDSVKWDALYSRSRLADFITGEIRILGAEDHLRSLCIHCLKHGVASPLWLVDVAVGIEGRPANFDWDLCIGTREPQANWIRCALSLAHRLFQANIGGTPIAEFLNELPGWLLRSVLRRWSRPPVPAALPRLGSVLTRRTGMIEALAWRWPSVGQTTVDRNAMFTRVPNIYLQLQSFFKPAKLRTFVSDFPTVWRETRKSSSGTSASGGSTAKS